jgi:hypothetical protein
MTTEESGSSLDARLRDVSGLPYWHVHRSRVEGASSADAVTEELGRVADLSAGVLSWQLTPWVGRRLTLSSEADTASPTPMEPTEYAVDMTHAVAMVRVEASLAFGALAKICPIDFSRRPKAFALRTSMAQVGVEVVRHAALDDDFLLIFPRSFGPYFYDVIRDAAC